MTDERAVKRWRLESITEMCCFSFSHSSGYVKAWNGGEYLQNVEQNIAVDLEQATGMTAMRSEEC